VHFNEGLHGRRLRVRVPACCRLASTSLAPSQLSVETLESEIVVYANLLVCLRLSRHFVAAHKLFLPTIENLKLFHLLIVAGGLSVEDLGGVSVFHVSEILPPPGI
jgi:hypothetical protein